MLYDGKYNEYIKNVKDLIGFYTKHDSGILSNILSSVSFLDGKFLRSFFLFVFANICKADELKESDYKKCVGFGAAIELIHLATLVHDDVIDEADKRRGSPSVNSVNTNRVAILTGDFIFSNSFKIMSDFSSGSEEVLKTISKACEDVVFGEIEEEILINNYDLKFSDYERIIENKTSKLFAASCVSGGLIAKSDKIDQILQFAIKVGNAFQMTDDIIDYFIDEKDSGKKKFSDIKSKKMTLPVLILRDLLDDENSIKLRNIIEKSEEISQEDISFTENLMKKFDIFKKSNEFAKKEIDIAKKIILDFNNCKDSDILLEMCNKILL